MQEARLFILVTLILVLGACSKSFLDTRPRSDIREPSSLNDLRAMLEVESNNATPALPVLAADEYYYRGISQFNTVSPTERNSYTWEKDVFGGETARWDWRYPYIGIFYANSVLEALAKMDSASTPEGRKIRGWALFTRAHNYYNLVKCFAPIYNQSTAASDLGVPLRLSASVDNIFPRASVQEVYNQIFADLNEARILLPEVLPMNRNKPCMMAADALLARICITQRNYVEAEKYADSCLARYDKLIDYDTIRPVLSNTNLLPFPANNDETLFATATVNTYTVTRVNTSTNTSIDTVLLKMYNTNDLRLLAYFGRGATTATIKKGYFGNNTAYPFTGIATDEVYLIKAECAARRNATDISMDFLNRLLRKRFKPANFVALTANSGSEALALVLNERRKELVMRGLRWDDLVRLNKEGANITLKRVLDGNTFSLPPNSPRYVFNIPADEIALSGITQNER